MQDCLSFAMQASLDLQVLRAHTGTLIENSRRACRLSRQLLQASDNLIERVWKPQPWQMITTTPGSIVHPHHLLLLTHGIFEIDECAPGHEYEYARNIDSGLIGIYESRESAVAAQERFSSMRRSLL